MTAMSSPYSSSMLIHYLFIRSPLSFSMFHFALPHVSLSLLFSLIMDISFTPLCRPLLLSIWSLLFLLLLFSLWTYALFVSFETCPYVFMYISPCSLSTGSPVSILSTLLLQITLQQTLGEILGPYLSFSLLEVVLYAFSISQVTGVVCPRQRSIEQSLTVADRVKGKGAYSESR